MSIITEADRTIRDMDDKIDDMVSDLIEICAEKVSGSEEYNREYRNRLTRASLLLLQVKELLD